MLNSITTKLEIDVTQLSDLDRAVQLAVAHGLPTLVVHPALAAQALVTKVKRQGRFKIITMVDWPKGDSFGKIKLRGLSTDAIGLDGFEILLSGNKTKAENHHEALELTNFIRTYLSTTAEIRLVLNNQTRPQRELLQIVDAIDGLIAPAWLRTDCNLKQQAAQTAAKATIATVLAIVSKRALPIKISCNVDSIKAIANYIAALGDGVKFAVGLQQLNCIVNELTNDPDGARTILNGSLEAYATEHAAIKVGAI